MSQENVEVVQQFLAAFVEVDEGLAEPQRLSQFITPDFTASSAVKLRHRDGTNNARQQ